MRLVINVLSLDASQAWFMGKHHPSYVLKRLHFFIRQSNAMSNLEAKRLVRAVKAGEPIDIPLEDSRFYEAICQCLTSLGVNYDVVGNPDLSIPQPPAD